MTFFVIVYVILYSRQAEARMQAKGCCRTWKEPTAS